MLRLIAPFRAAFDLDSSLIAAKPADFASFLKFVEDKLGNPQTVADLKIPSALDVKMNIHQNEGDYAVACRYSGFNRNGSQYFLPNIFTLRFKHSGAEAISKICNDAALSADEKVKPYSKYFSPDIGSLQVDLQDNTIAIFSIELIVNRGALSKGEHIWDRLDDWTIHFVQHMLLILNSKIYDC